MSDAELNPALEAAHLPALLAAMVHMTGDPGWLKPEWTPVYTPLSRGDPGLSDDVQADIRAKAKVVIEAFLAGGPVNAASPDRPTLRRMMDFVGGGPIPDVYADFLIDELAISGKSSKDPQFEQPKLKEAARQLKVLVIGAGMSGVLAGVRLSQAGVPFEIVESNPDVGGTWLVNTYPGCRVDNSNHMYSYSFEPNHAWPQYFSPQPELLKYFRGVAAKYDLKKHIRFETRVESLAWDEARSLWRVE
ncbi:MAG: 4-hydroxyacetophenone monooxygenase, partial [Phenylobacterium sp.]|nr:4-hydroxyacetophenone monooxygenase [Phenylobacterium sp.]